MSFGERKKTRMPNWHGAVNNDLEFCFGGGVVVFCGVFFFLASNRTDREYSSTEIENLTKLLSGRTKR